MTVKWSGLSPELILPLDRNHSDPLRVQLERGLREAIRTGRLHADERLPSSRELAQTLGVSRRLIVECFDQLQAEGYLTTKVGSGTLTTCTPVAPTSQCGRSDSRSTVHSTVL